MRRLPAVGGISPTIGLLVLIALYLAWEIVSRTLAMVYLPVDLASSAAWNPRLGPALVEQARQHANAYSNRPLTLENKNNTTDLDAADRLARQALIYDPLAYGALTQLAQNAEQRGDRSRATKLMTLAAKMSLHDVVPQVWFLKKVGEDKQFETMLPYLDAMLRTNPNYIGQAVPLLAFLVSYGSTAKAVAAQLATNPPWRQAFLLTVIPTIRDPKVLETFHAAMAATAAPLTEAETEPFVDALVGSGHFAQAYKTWLAALPADRRSSIVDTFYNAHFQYPIGTTKFDWLLTPVVGATADIVPDDADELHVLRVDFSGARIYFRYVKHLLVLKPGTYRLTGQAKAEGLRTERGLWWRLFCYGRESESLGQSDLLANSQTWTPFSATFVVPADKCPAQILELELPSRVETERTIAGTVYYKGLSLTAR